MIIIVIATPFSSTTFTIFTGIVFRALITIVALRIVVLGLTRTRRRIATLVGTYVMIITFQRFAGLARTIAANITHGTQLLVITGLSVVGVDTSGLRITAIIGTFVTIVAILLITCLTDSFTTDVMLRT